MAFPQAAKAWKEGRKRLIASAKIEDENCLF
jgi:hypothetical protein